MGLIRMLALSVVWKIDMEYENRKRPGSWVLFAVWTVLVICGNGVEQTAARQSVVCDTLFCPGLPLPGIPDSLRTASARASYLLAHFWDAMDFRDTLYVRNRICVEQNLVDFFSVFPHAVPEARVVGVRNLMRCAEADTEAYRLFAELAEKYLYERDSPMFREEYFILFLEEIVRSSVLSDEEKIRPAYLLEAAKKNRPGMSATDFAYLTRDGKRTTLRRTPGERLLLIFYDPDCRHCAEVMKELSANTLFRQQTDEGKLTVLALYADGDRMVWDRTKNDLPPGWTVGFGIGDIRKKELYVLPTMPTLYLLDREKRILLKDASLQQLTAILVDIAR